MNHDDFLALLQNDMKIEKDLKSEPIQEVINDCPLDFLLERDVGVFEICPERGLHLVAGYSLSQELRHRIEFWTLGQFDRLLIALGETRNIKKRVVVSSLNAYRLPKN